MKNMSIGGIVRKTTVLAFAAALAAPVFGLGARAEGARGAVAPPLLQQRRQTPPPVQDDKPAIGSLQQRAAPQADMTVVPNVVGMVFKKAIPVIQAAGLYATASEALSTAKNKTVASQSPAAGTRVPKKTFVKATVR